MPQLSGGWWRGWASTESPRTSGCCRDTGIMCRLDSSCGGKVGKAEAGLGSVPAAPLTLGDLGQLAFSLGLGFLICVMRRPD